MNRASAFLATIADLIRSDAANLLGLDWVMRALAQISANPSEAAAGPADTTVGSVPPPDATTTAPLASTTASLASTSLNTAAASLATAISPDGSILLAGSGGSLTTAAGTWTFGAGANAYGSPVLLNGARAAGGSATKLEVANKGRLYADNAQNDWYLWSGGSWSATSAPPTTTTTGTTSSTTVDRLPVLLKPSQSGDIVGMRLENPLAATEKSGYVTFGQVFKPGAVNPNDTLVARINGVSYAVQMDVKATNADGSVRHAILTLKAPSIAAGGHLDLMLAKGAAAAPSPSAPSASALLAGDYNLTVNFAFHNANGPTTNVTASAASTLQAALTGGKVENWLSGPGVNEFDVGTSVDGGKLKVDFHIRAYADGTTTTDVVFDNGWMFASGKTDLNYDVTINQAGSQVYSAAGVSQYLYSTWHHLVAGSGTISPNVQYNIPYLEATGAIAPYDTSLGVSSAMVADEIGSLTSGNTGPLGTAGVTTYMPETGGRSDIGLQPAWTVAALLSQDPAATQAMFANADAAGGIPWHFTDEKTGEAVNTQTYPDFWNDYRGTLVPASGWPSANPADPWTPEAAHMPDLNYIPYLLSGSLYQLGELQAEANFALSTTDPGYGSQYLIDGKYPAGFVLDGINEIRAEAWDLREVAEAAYLTPDSDPLKSYFVAGLQTNMQALVQQYIVDDIDDKYGAIKGFVGMKFGETMVAPWQEGYLVTVLGEIAGMNMPQASAEAVQMLKYMNNFVAGLYTEPVSIYNPLNGPGYWLAVADPTTGSPYTTWSQFYSANVKLGNLTGNPTSLAGYPLDTQGGYPAIAAAALATEITYTKSPQAIQAYGYVVSQIANEFAKAGNSMIAAYQASPIWTEVARLPDGVLLTHSRMQIDTSANNVTLTAKNGDSLLSVVGGGTDVLNGGTGGCDLMFGGSGNDTFNDGTGNDYLFGGSGTNTFVDNVGNDYYRAAGKANTFVFDDIQSGHDTVANFHAASDVLRIAANLGGNGITSAAQLIAGATTNGGNTVLHLGGGNDVTLLGISTPSSLGGSLLFN